MSHFNRRTSNALPLSAALAVCLAGADASAWSISGTVKNTTGTALSGVAVTVKDSATYKTTTDASGKFSLASANTGVVAGEVARSLSVRVSGSELVVEGLADGALDLSLVDASGRSLWASQVNSNQGRAQAALPSGAGRGALFLRIRHAGGVEFRAVAYGPAGISVSAPAARAMASLPVLSFSLSGYNDTTYAMSGATETGVTVTLSSATTCSFPTTFKWKDYGSAIASPKGNNWVSIKDFTNVTYNGKHYIYGSTHDANAYGSMGMAPFAEWSEAAAATQTKMNTSVVAPELMYFTPKSMWILSYQWGSAKFNYMTSKDPANANGWSGGGALLTEDVTKADGAQYGPIDHVPICDAKNCYLFYAGDNGHIYRASMPIGNFPGVFSGSKSIMSASTSDLFEAVEVYTVKGTGKYLMIVECMGSARYFRAFSATDLGGTWTAISNGESTPFAGRKNITNPPSWTNDISHGDLVRGADETRTVDPCNLQLLYQGYDASFSGKYDLKPYKLGLLTFVR